MIGAAKNLPTVEKNLPELVRAGADRRALLVAVVAGWLGDVAGFVAASYARGIGWCTSRRRSWRRWTAPLGANRRKSSGREKTWSERFILRNW